MQKNKKIFFIGRLEPEKWVNILLDIMTQCPPERHFEFHVIGDGLYSETFSKICQKNIYFYGKLSHTKTMNALQKADFLLMPSAFLETFGLVALEALMLWVPVIGFKKGWLENFIPKELALDEDNPTESFFHAVDNYSPQIFEKISLKPFLYENWVQTLEKMTINFQKILLVHDFCSKIWWAEIYVGDLKRELEKLWKTVEWYGYSGEISPKIRKKLFLGSIFDKRTQKELTQKIITFNPDLIWSHTVLRYIGRYGMEAIQKSQKPHFMTHHDLGLFVARPSKIRKMADIPKKRTLGAWLSTSKSFVGSIDTTLKYWIVKQIFAKIPKNTLHIVPSDWMKIVLKNNNITQKKIFPHTVFKK